MFQKHEKHWSNKSLSSLIIRKTSFSSCAYGTPPETFGRINTELYVALRDSFVSFAYSFKYDSDIEV